MQNVMFRQPLSGDVTQSWVYNPVLQTTSTCLQQMGFVNINVLGSTNRAMEEKITQEVAGYGQQLGWILETLVLVIDKLQKPIGKLNEEEQKKVMRIKNLLDDINNVRKSLLPAV